MTIAEGKIPLNEFTGFAKETYVLAKRKVKSWTIYMNSQRVEGVCNGV